MIEGNDDFYTQATNKGWDLGGSRNGTEEKRYVISGYNITNHPGYLIKIRNTDVFFEITNNILSGAVWGIHFYNVKNGHIFNNTIYNNTGDGIELHTSSNYNVVSNNTIFDSEYMGIRIFDSAYNTITNNIVHNSKNYHGIAILYKSTHNFVNRDTVYGNKLSGINIGSSSKDNIISHNIIFSNSGGIESEFSENNIFNDNTVYSNTYPGIYLKLGAKNHTISANTVYNNGGAGIITYGSTVSDNIITWNNFKSNCKNPVPANCIGGIQGLDSGTNNQFSYNYWDDHTTPDILPKDAIVDTPYNLDGGIGSQDQFPLVIEHKMTKPIISSPYGGSHSISIDIQWEETGSTYNHSSLYSIYFSINKGLSWKLLISDLSTTNFIWDITGISNRSNSLIKVIAKGSEGLITEGISSFFEIKHFTPHRPADLKAEFLENKIKLTWNTPNEGSSTIIEYRIYMGTIPGSYSFLASTIQNEYNDTTILFGQIYYYAISAVNIIGEGSYSEINITTPLVKSSVPLNLRDVIENGITTLSWTEPINNGGSIILYYLVYRGNTSGIYNQISNVTSTSYQDSSIDLRKTYYYAVTGVNKVGESDYSNEIISHDYFKPTFTVNPFLHTVTQIKAVVNITVSPFDANGVDRVEFLLGTSLIGNVSTPPYLLLFDTTGLADAYYEFTIKVIDNAGNVDGKIYLVKISNTETSTTSTTPTPTTTTPIPSKPTTSTTSSSKSTTIPSKPTTSSSISNGGPTSSFPLILTLIGLLNFALITKKRK